MASKKKKGSNICVVDPMGNITCGIIEKVVPNVFGPAQGEIFKALGAIHAVSPPRRKLIMRLIEEVMQSPLDDKCLAARSDDVVESVHYMLQSPPPVMILFQYVALPGIIMAQYYIEKGELQQASEVLTTWSTLQPSCT